MIQCQSISWTNKSLLLRCEELLPNPSILFHEQWFGLVCTGLRQSHKFYVVTNPVKANSMLKKKRNIAVYHWQQKWLITILANSLMAINAIQYVTVPVYMYGKIVGRFRIWNWKNFSLSFSEAVLLFSFGGRISKDRLYKMSLQY